MQYRSRERFLNLNPIVGIGLLDADLRLPSMWCFGSCGIVRGREAGQSGIGGVVLVVDLRPELRPNSRDGV